MHDIRHAIPQTDQTMQGKFPQYEFRAYPKMPHDENGKPYAKGDKSFVVVNDEHEEALFRADPKRFGAIISTSVPASGATVSNISKLANESEEIAQLRAQIAELKAEKSAPVETKKRGRPAKAKIELPADLG
jgi:hypothetical protein